MGRCVSEQKQDDNMHINKTAGHFPNDYNYYQPLSHHFFMSPGLCHELIWGNTCVFNRRKSLRSFTSVWAEVSLCVLGQVCSQMSGQKEDGLLSDVSPWTQFSFSVLFQSHVPVPLLIFLR